MKNQKVNWQPMPATKIMMSLAPMMAKAYGWPVGRDMESKIRMTNKYMEVAATLN